MSYYLFRKIISYLPLQEQTPLDLQILQLAKLEGNEEWELSQTEIDRAPQLYPSSFTKTGIAGKDFIEAYMAGRIRTVLRNHIDDILGKQEQKKETEVVTSFYESLTAKFPLEFEKYFYPDPEKGIEGPFVISGRFASLFLFIDLSPTTGRIECSPNSPQDKVFKFPPKENKQTLNYARYDYCWFAEMLPGVRVPMKLEGDRQKTRLVFGGRDYFVTQNSSWEDLLLFYQALWGAIVMTPQATDLAHTAMTEPVSSEQAFERLTGSHAKKDTGVLMLDEGHQGKGPLLGLQAGVGLQTMFEVHDDHEENETPLKHPLTLSDLKISYRDHLGFDPLKGIFYFVAPPPEDPQLGTLEFGYVFQFLWESSSEKERKAKFKTYSSDLHPQITGEHTLEKIAEHTYTLAATNPSAFYYSEDFYHIPMWAIAYFEIKKDEVHLEILKQQGLERVRQVVNEGRLIEYNSPLQIGKKTYGVYGFVGHTTEFLGKLAASPLVYWTEEEKKLVQAWIHEIKVATPRGIPSHSGELSHLVLGLNLLEAHRDRVGI